MEQGTTILNEAKPSLWSPSLLWSQLSSYRDTDNNKLHNEKTPQPTKGQRYDRLNRKRIFQTSWKKKITWNEASGRLINLVI
jgi:hypothetical protein